MCYCTPSIRTIKCNKLDCIPKEKTVSRDALNSLAWPAMRYALGRKTYVVDTVCRALISNARDIRSDIKVGMKREIDKAICSDEAGMPMDVEQWKQVMEAFETTTN